MTRPSPASGSFSPLKPIVFDILVILAQGDRHGWGIVKGLETGPGGGRKVFPGNLYRTLRDMKERGLIEESETRPDPEEADERRQYYRITDRGRAAARSEVLRLENRLRAAHAAGLLSVNGSSSRSR